MHRACLLATVLLAAAGCRSYPERPDTDEASFAWMDTIQRDYAIWQAIHDPLDESLRAVDSARWGNRADPTCPASTVEGSGITFTADDCTNEDGTHFDGVVYARNVPSTPGELPIEDAAPMTIELRDWRGPNELLDGIAERDVAVPANGALVLTTASYTRWSVSAFATIDMSADCTHRDDGDDCAIAGVIDIPRSRFDYEGDVRTSGPLGTVQRGQVTLRGDDTLVVDFDAPRCPYTIDGEPAGEFCPISAAR